MDREGGVKARGCGGAGRQGGRHPMTQRRVVRQHATRRLHDYSAPPRRNTRHRCKNGLRGRRTKNTAPRAACNACCATPWCWIQLYDNTEEQEKQWARGGGDRGATEPRCNHGGADSHATARRRQPWKRQSSNRARGRPTLATAFTAKNDSDNEAQPSDADARANVAP